MRYVIMINLVLFTLDSCTCIRNKKNNRSAGNTSEEVSVGVFPKNEISDVVIFDKDYIYDAENLDASNPAYDISRSYIFHQDGTGDFQGEDAGKFRWKADVKGEVPYVIITDIYDIKDPEGVPYPEQEQSGMDMRFEVSADKQVLTEIAENGLVLTISTP